MKKFVLFNLGLFFSMFVNSNLQAFELKPEEIRGETSKPKVAVLQNRFFLKKMRPEVGIFAGKIMNESYTSSTIMGARVGLFFNEWVGMEFQYFTVDFEDSADRKNLKKKTYRDYDNPEKTVHADVEVNPLNGGMDLNAVIAPFYGKFNFIDKYIVYSDLYLTAGLSSVDTDVQGNKTAVILGAGFRFHMYQSLSFRLDFRDRIYNEKIMQGKETSTKNSMTVDFGINYFFL